MADSKGTGDEVIALRIVRTHEGIEPKYTNHFVVQADGPEFHIRFYQMCPPIILGSSEELPREVEALDGKVEAKCIAHIVFARDRLPEFVQLLTTHAAKYLGGKLPTADNQSGRDTK